MTVQIGIPVTSPAGLGLGFCIADGRSFVEGIDPLGSVAQWNGTADPETQIGFGDRIESFKVKGQSAQKLVSGRELLHMERRAVVLKVTKPSIYSVKAKAPYGIPVKRKPDNDKTFFMVRALRLDGSIEKWNEEFPDRPVSIGDIVREVNGVEGSAAEVQKMLVTDPDEEKDLLIYHFP